MEACRDCGASGGLLSKAAIFFFATAFLWSALAGFSANAEPASPLDQGFAQPPDAAKPWVYWWWLKGNVSQEGITKDLEEMKRQGINGVLIFHAGGEAGPMPAGERFLSPRWREMFRHALREAGRLGMEASINLCDGWDSGGSWITPDQANKKLVCSEVQVEGPRQLIQSLPMPAVVDDYYRDATVIALREKDQCPLAPARVTASSSLAGYCEEWNYPPEDAVDGDPETCWQSNNTAPSLAKPASLTLEYHESFPAVGVYVMPPADNGPRECELQGAMDGKSFNSICRFTLEKGRGQRMAFPEARAKQFRLLITSAFGAPVQVAEIVLLRKGDEPHLRPGIKWWGFKSANRSFWDWPRQGPVALKEEYTEPDGARDCSAKDVLDLTAKMDAQGKFTWDAPPGRWTVLRFGYTLEGQRTRCGDSIGYEADMLGSKGIECHFAHTAEPLLQEAAAAGGKVLKYLHIDSYELGADVRGQQPTWSEAFREEFKTRRGYDLLPYLPALARRVVDNREITSRFLWDFRRTIGDLMAERFWKRFAELAHARGVGVHMETGYGTYPYPHIDGLQCAGMSDIPMGEFWHGTDIMSQFDPWGNVIRSVASAAHVYGHPLVQAESFTSWNHWAESPFLLKSAGDQAFCDGLNRMVFHQYTHQPQLDMKPGWQYGAGTHFDRNITWWEQSRAFFQYLGRCQHLLQQGRFHADVAYFYGEGVTTFVPGREHLKPALPAGYNFDAVNADVLLNRLSVKEGRLALLDGLSYRLLVLPEEPMLSPKVLRKLKAFVADGATVLGPKPQRSPGLTDYPQCDREVAELAAEIWGDCDGQKVQERRFGKGRIFWGKSLKDILTADEVKPDFEYASDRQWQAGLRGAAWIWHAEDGENPPPAERFFRTEFEIPVGSNIIAGEAAITADNEFELQLNGITLCRGDNFHQVHEADLSGSLRRGKNQLQVRVVNTGGTPNPAGLIARVVIRLDSGSSLVVATGDRSWLSSKGDGPWIPARKIGEYGCPPWGSVAMPETGLSFIHRTVDDAEVYFVANPNKRWEKNLRCSFRIADRVPEIWNPVTGEIRDAFAYTQAGGQTILSLEFAPHGSLFIVFRKPAVANAVAHRAGNFPLYSNALELTGPWTVKFDPKWGGPESVQFDQLTSWTRRSEEGIKFYSGTARYVKQFDVPADLIKPGRRLALDLGEVRHLAEVRLNGINLGVVWTAPFRVDITEAVKPAGNQLEIDVVNLWPNRLIGDAALPREKRLTRTNVSMDKHAPLLDSGLLGAVTLQSAD